MVKLPRTYGLVLSAQILYSQGLAKRKLRFLYMELIWYFSSTVFRDLESTSKTSRVHGNKTEPALNSWGVFSIISPPLKVSWAEGSHKGELKITILPKVHKYKLSIKILIGPPIGAKAYFWYNSCKSSHFKKKGLFQYQPFYNSMTKQRICISLQIWIYYIYSLDRDQKIIRQSYRLWNITLHWKEIKTSMNSNISIILETFCFS